MTFAREDPGAGDPHAIRREAWTRQERAEELLAMTTRVHTAASEASGASWAGSAHQAFQTAVAQAVPDLDIIAASLLATADALLSYADQVAQIKEAQVALERRRFRLESELEDMGALLAFADGDAADAAVERRLDEVRGLTNDLAQLEDHWDELIARRERADADCIAQLSSREVRGALHGFASAAAACAPAGELLHMLSTMTASDMKTLAAAHPDLLDRMLRASPEVVAAWWAELGVSGSAQENLLVNSLPAFIGALGGVPAAARVAANRLIAAEQLEKLRMQLADVRARGYGTDSTVPYADDAAVAEYLQAIRALEPEIATWNESSTARCSCTRTTPPGSESSRCSATRTPQM